MRKQFTPVLLFLSLIIILFSCKKTDSIRDEAPPPVDRFFSAPSNSPKEIKAIAQALKKQNDQFNYLSSITKRAGYPRWDKARIANYDKGTITARGSEEASGEFVYIPFVKDSDNYVNALLAVKMDGSDTVYRMIYATNYKAFGYDTSDHSKWSARDVFNIFTSFDYSVFGHTKFWVKDTNLFKPESDSSYVIVTRVSNTTQSSSARASIYTVAECTAYTVCTYPGAGPGPGGGEGGSPSGGGPLIARMAGCTTYDYCTVYSYGDVGGSGVTGTSDGTGGSGGSGWYSGGGSGPCAGSTPVERTARVQIASSCGGWVPVTTDPVPTSNDPCAKRAEIASRQANQTIANINSGIKNFILNNINSTIEAGAEHNLKSLSNTNDFVNISTRSSNQSNTFVSNFTWNPTNGYTVGVSHGHNPASAPSPADVIWMYGNLTSPDLVTSGTSGIDYYKSHVSVTAVTLGNTYVISPSSWPALQTAYNEYQNSNYTENGIEKNTKSELYGIYGARYKATHPAANDEVASIYALLVMYGNAIHLFKALPGSNTYEVMTLDANGNVITKICN